MRIHTDASHATDSEAVAAGLRPVMTRAATAERSAKIRALVREIRGLPDPQQSEALSAKSAAALGAA